MYDFLLDQGRGRYYEQILLIELDLNLILNKN